MPTEPAAGVRATAARPARVLVVKDRKVTGRRYLHELRSHGFEVTHLYHGRRALSALLDGGHDLLLFEVRCDARGNEDATLLRVLRTYLRRFDTPVILASFFPDRWTPARRQAMGVADVLHQPVSSPADVVRAARRALGLADPAADRPRWQASPPGRRVA